MKTDLRSLKKEFAKLTDLDYLKKEFTRVAQEVKNLDVHLQPIHLTPAARHKLEQLEKRFRDLLHSIQELQKQVDSNLDKFISMVREKRDRSGKNSSQRQSTARSATRAPAAKSEPATTVKKPETKSVKKSAKKVAASSAAGIVKPETARSPSNRDAQPKSPKARKTKAK